MTCQQKYIFWQQNIFISNHFESYNVDIGDKVVLSNKPTWMDNYASDGKSKQREGNIHHLWPETLKLHQHQPDLQQNQVLEEDPFISWIVKVADIRQL